MQREEFLTPFLQLRCPLRRSGRSENGYVLLTLMLFVSLMVIAAAVIAPTISFEIRRDREEELIHRGVQYSRAIRAYYKKFNRYPTKLEDLESANNLRFLRKRYKDPITGQDFKLLHYGEVKMSFAGGISGGNIPGATPIGAAAAGGVNGGFGQIISTNSSFGGNSNFGGNSGFGGNSSFGGNSGLGANSSNSFGSNNGFGANVNSTTPNQPGANPTSGTDSQQPQSPDAQQNPNGTSGNQQAGQVFGGGPIVGVVSTSKKESIREFNHKKKYEEWQFVYDPTMDRGGLLMTPNQPPLQGSFSNMQGQNPQNPNNSAFGTPAGMQNNPNPMSPNGPGIPTPPTTTPQQQ